MCSIWATASSIAADAHCNMYVHMIFMNIYTCAWIQRVWHEPQVLNLGYCIHYCRRRPLQYVYDIYEYKYVCIDSESLARATGARFGLLHPVLPQTPTAMNIYSQIYICAHRYGESGASHSCLDLGYCVQVCHCPLRYMYIYIYMCA